MRGSIVQRHKGSFSLVLDFGYVTDPESGLRQRKQKWVTFRPAAGTPAKIAKQQAEAKLAELVNASYKGDFIEPSKTTVAEWLTVWLTETVQPSVRRNTFDQYSGAVKNHLPPALGGHLLQALRPARIKQYHLERIGKLSGTTLQLHHVILNSALKSAVRNGLLSKNVAEQVDGRPRAKDPSDDAKLHCRPSTRHGGFSRPPGMPEPRMPPYLPSRSIQACAGVN